MWLLFRSKMAAAANTNEADEENDPEKLIDAVVDQVKSGGLFDHFRKECLEELENLVNIQ